MLGHSVDELSAIASKIGATNLDDVLKYLNGKSSMGQTIPMVGKTLNDVSFGQASKTVGRFAGGNVGRGIARVIPGISAAVNVLDAADIVAGDTSLGNKVMDTVGMGIGGTAGFLMGGGPIGASIGASTGKAISDGVQGIFGGGKSAEERRMEEALLALRGGRI